MFFYVEGPNNHDLMPLTRIFDPRIVNKIDVIKAARKMNSTAFQDDPQIRMEQKNIAHLLQIMFIRLLINHQWMARYLDILIVHHVAQRSAGTAGLKKVMKQPWTLVTMINMLLFQQRPCSLSNKPITFRRCPFCGILIFSNLFLIIINAF